MDSLLLSTLECLYQGSECLPIIFSAVSEYGYVDGIYPVFNLRPLVHDSTRDRHSPNTSLSTVIKELMIEQWNPVSSYEQFYRTCAPLYCSYIQTIRKRFFIGLVMTLMSMIGGIVVSLRVLTPHLVSLALQLLKKNRQQSTQGNYLYNNMLFLM